MKCKSLPSSALFILSFFAIVLLTTFCGCKDSEKYKNETEGTFRISTVDSLKVAQEIDAVINGYTQAHIEMNAEKAADYFLNSPEMLVVENGERYANWESLAKLIKDYYATTSSAKFRWEEKRITVFSSTSGLMTGKFNFESISKDKKKYASTGWATILIIKQNNQWKFHQYHESYKILTK